MYFLIPLVAAIAPFVIWPIELLLPFPYIIEEIVKGILIVFVIDLPGRTSQVKIVLASAAIFTLSETVLYILNISLVGDFSTLLIRFILTNIMHSLTMLIILISTFKHKWFMSIGVAAAILIHYFFNLTVGLIN
ncbi:PrsW family intramembrane metalloprotease [Patescibacteria group bacterium]|nr:PrsW family intramembrane metalloprotease [Patescibacteria group bacterium]